MENNILKDTREYFFGSLKSKDKKTRRKRKIIGIFFLLGTVFMIAQMVVTDPEGVVSNHLQLEQMIEQVQEAQRQTSQLTKMKDGINKNLEILQTVNRNVQNIERIQAIAENQANIYNECMNIKRVYSGSDYLEVLLQSERLTNKILSNTERNISELSKILNSGFFNMNDAERLENIRNYEKETNKQLGELMTVRRFLKYYEDGLKVYGTEKNNKQLLINK